MSEKAMAPHSSTLAWKIPWTEEPGRLQSMDTTEQLHFHFSLSCIGEGNGNPLQCSCLEYPRDGGAWWAAVYGVAQRRTWLKRLSSSSRLSATLRVCLAVSVRSDSLQPYGLWPDRLLCPWDSPGKNTGVGCHALLQGIFPTQGSNLYRLWFLHCRQILYCWATGETLIDWNLFC